MSLGIPKGQQTTDYLHSCSEEERLRIFKKAHYEQQMYGRCDREIQDVYNVMKKMGYKWGDV